MHKYHKSCSLIWPFYDLLQLNDLKYQKTHKFQSYLRLFDRFISVHRKLISPPFQVSKIVFLGILVTTNRSPSLFDHFLTVLRLTTNGVLSLWPKKSENSYLHHFSAQVSQIVFFAYLTVLQLITTLRPIMSENSYLRHFSAQVSQIVFLANLTVLRLITTVWPEMSENSYLRHFSALVSQIVFLAYLTVLRLITTLWP